MSKVTLTFDLLTLKVVSESRVTYVGYLSTSVPILVFYVLDLAIDVRDRQTDRRQTASSLNAPPIRGGGIIFHSGTTRVCGGASRDEIKHVIALPCSLQVKSYLNSGRRVFPSSMYFAYDYV